MKMHNGTVTGPFPEKREEVKSAFDKDFDPTYGEGQGDRQTFYGGNSFANLRDEVNERRRRMARRTSGRDW
jgi:hypothetical protein